MEKTPWFSSSLILLLLCSSLAAAAQARPADFRHLDKLEGAWIMRTKQSVIIERWARLNDSCWQGQTWRKVGQDSSLQETIQLLRTADGIYFIPTVANQNSGQPVRFKLRVLKDAGFVAENPQHDFPQKIIYRFKDDRHLDARIEGKQDKTFSQLLFQYVKE
jgi:hypothetical protein